MTPAEIRDVVFSGLDYLVRNSAPGRPWGARPENLAEDFAALFSGKVFTIDDDGSLRDDVNNNEDFMEAIHAWFERYPTRESWIVKKEMGF